ncbi:MAG: hypothetical protein RLZZ232_2540 [Planctomycetota bacterium]|jgi:hypothetical protein
MRKAIRMIALLLLVFQLPGCFLPFIRTSSTVSAPTVGRQLVDLKEALDSGAITPEEFQRKREEIINSGLQLNVN